MRTTKICRDIRSAVTNWRREGASIAFVPTMGSLHDGHLALVDAAKQRADRVVASIFVNPLQFSAGEDFTEYPRDPQADSIKLAERDVDLLYLPEVDEVYGRPLDQVTRVHVPGLADILCGASRPGHFDGVATVVTQLFNIVQPDVAVFGEKDYQQLVLIRRLTADLRSPVEILGVATQRDSDGLALSSRNAYLSAAQRSVAPRLYQVLQALGDALQRVQGGHLKAVEQMGRTKLEEAGLRPDYLRILRAEDLARPGAGDTELVILAAVYLGKVRLIDNLRVSLVTEGG